MYFSSSFILAALPLLATAAPGFQLPFAAKIGDAVTRPGSGDVIDLTKYTIGQILNYTLHQHHREHHGDHDHDHEHEELARALEDHPHDGHDHGHPHHPPLVKLAWIVNRTEAVSYKGVLSSRSMPVSKSLFLSFRSRSTSPIPTSQL